MGDAHVGIAAAGAQLICSSVADAVQTAAATTVAISTQLDLQAQLST